MSPHPTKPLPTIEASLQSLAEPVAKTRQFPVFEPYDNKDETPAEHEIRYMEHDPERAVAQELEFFDKWLDLKVKDELTVQLYKGATEHTIDLDRIQQLVCSLIEDERSKRQNRANKITKHAIPQAQTTENPVGRNDHYSQYDLGMLHFQHTVDSEIERIMGELLPHSTEVGLEMAASIVECLLPHAKEAVRDLRLEQEQEAIVVTPVSAALSYEDVVEELTNDARALAQ